MSLAYKLWKIGSILELNDMRECIQEDIPEKINDPIYINIDFKFNKENKIESILLKNDGVSKDKFFFSKKIGGSGTGIYYLYPNLAVQKGEPGDKLNLLINTVQSIINVHSRGKNKKYTEEIIQIIKKIQYDIEKFDLEKQLKSEKKKDKIKKIENKLNSLDESIKNRKEKLSSSENSLINIYKKISKFEKSDYIILFSINGKTFYEQMPEIWENWHNSPAVKNNDTKNGYDAFTNEETEIGYRPEVKVFSYDQYHDNYKHRINENLPLSQQSARNIKFAWIYILNNLVFKYKGLEYVIIPNLLCDDSEIHKTILKRLVNANKKSTEKKNILKTLHDKEAKIEKDLEKLKKKQTKLQLKKIDTLNEEYKQLKDEIENSETGLISELNEQVDEIGDLKNSITLDYLFTSINKTDLSFDIKGSIEDVIPSKFTQIVKAMDENDIDDKISLKMKNRKQNLLQNYFNRNELYLACNRSTLDEKYKLKNVIVKERIELAKLLLTDERISMEQLLRKFDYHRQKRYDLKKRITKEGTKEWIEYTNQFVLSEQRIYHFFQSLDKIKE